MTDGMSDLSTHCTAEEHGWLLLLLCCTVMVVEAAGGSLSRILLPLPYSFSTVKFHAYLYLKANNCNSFV